jgi:hypothetical protein
MLEMIYKLRLDYLLVTLDSLNVRCSIYDVLSLMIADDDYNKKISVYDTSCPLTLGV